MFVLEAGNKYGSRGKQQANALIAQESGLFAGGEMDEADMDVFMQAVQNAYWEVKKKNKEKYTPKKYKK